MQGPERITNAGIEQIDARAIRRVAHALDKLPEDSAECAAFPKIAGYVICDRLGEGGGGEVFLAVREHDDRPLAIKILRNRIGSSAPARRVWRELDLLRELRLPSAPRLIDHGLINDHLYLVTEFVDGQPIDQYCERCQLDRAERVTLIASVADAVQSLHENGVIHRDLKPANIMIGEAGQPILIDFGIAVLIDRNLEETITVEGTPIGSVAFMATEQARGDRQSISTRTDVYGIGATAYVLLTGKTPHQMADTLHDSIRRVAEDPPRHPREIEPNLPGPLAAVLNKSVAPEQDGRYASAAEFAADLRRWLRGQPVEAGDITLTQRLVRFATQHAVLTTASTCILVAALILLGTWLSVWWLNSRPYQVVLDPNHQAWARVVSRMGRPLHEWHTQAGHIRFAHGVHRPASLGGGRIVLLGFTDHDDPEYRNRICAFDWNSPETLLWSHGAGPPDLVMPEPISTNRGSAFRLNNLYLFDVFPESPGEEIVATFRLMPWSASAIQILDVRGRVLFEFWHDGDLFDAQWIPDPGLIVLAGFNSDGKWALRGYPEVENVLWPIVVFAVRPEMGRIHKEWIHSPGGKGTYRAEWYKCAFPPDALDEFVGIRIDLNATYRPSDASMCTLSIQLVHDPRGATLGFVLDASGKLIEYLVNDSYATAPDLPDPRAITIQDLPPIIETAEEIVSPPGDDGPGQ